MEHVLIFLGKLFILKTVEEYRKFGRDKECHMVQKGFKPESILQYCIYVTGKCSAIWGTALTSFMFLPTFPLNLIPVCLYSNVV